MVRIGLITARGGSKGIPGKNIKNLYGRPLISWTIKAALNSVYIDRVIVSTDDQDIANLSLQLKAEVPFLRPIELSTDEASSIDVVLHALKQIPEAEEIFLLQPTSPFRTSNDIDNIFRLREYVGVATAVSVTQSEKPPEWMYKISGNRMLNFTNPPKKATRRQELEQIYQLNGAIYLATKEHLEKENSFISGDTFPYIMPRERSIDIDTMNDWKMAELLASNFSLL